ncbi:MAG: hypothetical protein RSB55_10055, partial [Oscillospiraceae bacterium]
SDDRQLKVVFDTDKLKLVADFNAYVSASGNDTSGDGSKERPYATIGKAYTEVATSGTIYVMDDIIVRTNIAFNSNKVVTIISCKADGTPWATMADTHTISQSTASDVMFDVTQGTVNLANIVLKGRAAHDGRLLNVQNGATACIQDGTVLKDSVSTLSGGAAYIFTGGTLKMTGGTITGNSCTGANSCGGAVYAASNAHFQVQGDVKIYGNTKADSSVEGVYLMGHNILEVTNNLATTAHIDLGVNSKMRVSNTIGTTSGGTAHGVDANLSAIVAAPATTPNLMAMRNGAPNEIQWAEADKTWLDSVATASYGWTGGNTPGGTSVNTPSRLYSLAWAIQTDYQPLTGTATGAKRGVDYANGAYKLTANLDMTGFTWIPIGTHTIPFT